MPSGDMHLGFMMRTFMTTVLAVIVIAVASAHPLRPYELNAEADMTKQSARPASRNRALIDAWYSRMWNRWDKTAFPDLLCHDITLRGSLGVEVKGYEGVSAYMDQIRAAFPDFHNSVDEVISEEQTAFARLTYTGTHKGEVLGFAPTGRSITYAGAAVFRFQDGRICQVWVLGDLYNLAKQLQSNR